MRRGIQIPENVYTQEELQLLYDTVDFVAANSAANNYTMELEKGIPAQAAEYYRVHASQVSPEKAAEQIIRWLAKPEETLLFRDVMFQVPLEELPLLINDSENLIYIIKWRLALGR